MRRRARSTSSSSPRRPRSPLAVGRPRAARAPTSPSRPGGRARARSPRSSPASLLAVAHALLRRRAPRAAARCVDRLAGRAVAGRSRRCSSSCSASASRRRSLIVALVCFFPVVVNLYDGAAPPSTPTRASCWHARRLALAGVPRARGARARCPPRFTGAKVAAAVGGDRRRVRRVGRLGRRARPLAADREPAARDRAGVRGHRPADRARRRCSTPSWPCSSGASCPGRTRRPKEPARDPPPAALRLRPARRSPSPLAGCGEKPEAAPARHASR